MNKLDFSNKNILEKVFGDNVDIDEKIASLKQDVDNNLNLKASSGLGLLYHYGIGVDKDYKEAIKWFNKANSFFQNSSDIEYELGLIYLEGGFGIEQDYKISEDFLKKASDNGNINALYQLGCLYRDKQNYGKARKYFEKATENKHLEAQYELGLLYYFGLGVDLNKEKAEYLFYKSGKKGNISSKIFLDLIDND